MTPENCDDVRAELDRLREVVRWLADRVLSDDEWTDTLEPAPSVGRFYDTGCGCCADSHTMPVDLYAAFLSATAMEA